MTTSCLLRWQSFWRCGNSILIETHRETLSSFIFSYLLSSPPSDLLLSQRSESISLVLPTIGQVFLLLLRGLLLPVPSVCLLFYIHLLHCDISQASSSGHHRDHRYHQHLS